VKKLTEISDDILCPCGSKNPYAFCCKGKVLWKQDPKGKIYRSDKLSDEAVEVLKRYKKELEKKLGRPLKPSDKLFPGFNPRKFTEVLIQAFFKAKFHPQHIYTYLALDGLFVTPENIAKLTTDDKQLYDGFVNEFWDLSLQEKALVLSFLIKKDASKIAPVYNFKFCLKYLQDFKDEKPDLNDYKKFSNDLDLNEHIKPFDLNDHLNDDKEDSND